MSDLLTAALRYAAAGIAVFPVKVTIAGGKKDVRPIHKWRDNSTTSADLVNRWWGEGSEWQYASIAIDTGKSGLVVIDPDGQDGLTNWGKLVAEHGLPATWRTATPGGGEHWYYAENPRRVVGIDSSGKVAEHVDVRGLGGFVIAPPSADARGAYRWLEGEPEWSDLPVVPDLVADRMTARRPATGAPPAGTPAVAPQQNPLAGPVREFTPEQAVEFCTPALRALWEAQDGQINDRLNTAAITVGHFVPEFWTRAAAEKWLLDVLSNTVYDGATWKAEATIESGMSAADWKAVRVAPGEKMGPAARAERQSRPGLHVGSPANAAEWLRVTIGTGPLSGMFNRGGVVVHCPREGQDGYVPPRDERDNDGPAQVRPVTAGALAARIQYTYDCYKEKETDAGRERVAALFPGSAAKIPLEVPDMLPNLRTLRGVTHTPLVRADGTILNRPGYDPDTGYLYLPDAGLSVPEVPDRPSRQQVAAAVALLDEMTAGFQYVTSHDRANYYGALLTPLLRELVSPPYKMIVFTAPQPGSGKSLQAEVVRILHGGVFRSECPEDDAEMRKVVTTILDVTTGPVVTLDNVTGVLRSSALAGLLTSGRWEDRALGSNTLISRPNDRLWTLTGNNVSLGGDLVRRSVWVTIDPRVPHPELRTDFAITDLPGWARARRGELLAALLTLVRAWAVAGQPVHLERGDSFARWVAVIRGILSAAGVPGTFDHAESARQQVGTDDDDWSDFLRAAHQVFGGSTWTAKELLGKVTMPAAWNVPTGTTSLPESGIPLDALPGPIAERVAKTGQPGAAGRQLGSWLKNRDGRWAGPLVVRSAAEDLHTKVKLWRIESVEDKTPLAVAGSAGSAGSDSDPSSKKAVEDSGTPDGAPPGFSGHRPETQPAEPAEPASGRVVAGRLCGRCGGPLDPALVCHHHPGCAPAYACPCSREGDAA